MSDKKISSQLSSFKILNTIGKGGFGEVSSAERENGEKVAIKKIGREATDDRIKEEIRTMKRLEHRSIVKLYDAFVEDGATYLVMELCEGGSLISYVKEHGPLDDASAVHILRQLISAVTYMHNKGILHRDLSAGNVFIKDATKSKLTVKLGDFGLATNVRRGEVACTIVGTPGYIAPQVFNQQYAQEADVYSLGAVLYTMLTAKAPPAKGLVKKNEIRNPRAADLIARMMHQNANSRMQLKDIQMHPYIVENTDDEAKLYSREHSRDNRRQRSREPLRSRDANSRDRKPLSRSSSQPVYSGRMSASNRPVYDRMPTTSQSVISSEKERGREMRRNCGEGLGSSHERSSQSHEWPIRADRLAGQRIRTAGGRYIVEMDTRCRFEVAHQGEVVKRILIVELSHNLQSQKVYVHRISNRIVKCRSEREELIELTETPIVYTSLEQLPEGVKNDYRRLQKMIVTTLASRVAKITLRRPPQFPDAHAQLMENGDLRIKFQKSVIVRKKDNGDIYNCIDGVGSKKEGVPNSVATNVKEVYNFLVEIEHRLRGMAVYGMPIFPLVFSSGPDIMGNSNNSPSSMLPPSSQTSRFPFSNVSSNQQSLVPHSAPFLTKPVSSRPASVANLQRRVSTDENRAPPVSNYKWKRDRSGKVFSIEATDGRFLRLSTSVSDQFIFKDPVIQPCEQRFMRNGRVPERASEMLSVLLERVRNQI